MLVKLLISLMTIGLLAGCMQDEEEPQQDEQPMDEEIQENIDNIEEETDDMFEEGDVEQNDPETGTDDNGNIGDTGDTGDSNETDVPEESEGGDMTEEQNKPEDEEE